MALPDRRKPARQPTTTCERGLSLLIPSSYMLTAYHCGSGPYYDRAGEYIGHTGSLGNPERAADVAAITVKSNATSGNRMFDGTWDNSTGYSKAVGSRGSARKYVRYCASGANSGVRCSLSVYSTNSSTRYPGGQSVFGLVKTEQVAGGIAVAQGDSGGPVFGPHDGTWVNGKVQAIGIISGGYADLPCPSLAYSASGWRCFKKLWFQPVNTALTLYGVQLNYG